MPGYLVQAGSIDTVNLTVGAPVRTDYEQQVRRIAPDELRERDVELAELVQFCTDPTTHGQYWWWRAQAWSGKSALLAWFVLHPPKGVRIISFFITARWASQHNRAAFIDNLLEQLLAFLGRPMPTWLTDSTRETHLLGLLEDAAATCQLRGEQFVLVLDGLDEDRGSEQGTSRHSIAGLLPKQLPAGMRVITSGRADPPLPDDVPPDHPLRNPRVRHQLKPSPFAQNLRGDMLRELTVLLDGPQLGQDVLGLLVASGGGLSGQDFAELTDAPPRQIELLLNTVAGRSFASRPSRYRPATAPSLYLLAHEELDQIARDQIGQAALASYGERLHHWADTYRGQHWPGTTSDYLLIDYFDLLYDSDDNEPLVTYATDAYRHRQLRDRTGTDYVALEHIRQTRARISPDSLSNFRCLVRLALHRHHLEARARTVPVGLILAWAKFGRVEHATHLAQILPDATRRAQATAQLAEVCADRGDLDAAGTLLDHAQDLLSQVTVDGLRDKITVALAWTAERIGQPARADDLVARIVSTEEQVRAAVTTARAALAAAAHDRTRQWCRRAETSADELSTPYQVQVLVWLCETWVELGDRPKASLLLDTAVQLARDITDVDRQASSFAAIAMASMSNALRDGAAILDEAQSRADNGDPATRALAAAALVPALQTHDHDRAVHLLDKSEELARETATPLWQQVTALTQIASSAVALSDLQRAQRIVGEIAPSQRDRALMTLTVQWARMGHPEGSEQFARSIENPFWQADGLAAAALAWIEAGERERATIVLGEIEETAQTHAQTRLRE